MQAHAAAGDLDLNSTADLEKFQGIYLSEKLGREVTAEEVRTASVSSAAAV